MSIKIPKGLEKFEKITQKYNLSQIYGMAMRGINVPHDYRRESPSFAAIARFNNDMDLFKKFEELMHKHVGKYGASTMMKVAVVNDMGIDLVEELWSDRNVHISYNFISALEECDEKYIRFFIESPKFLRLMKKELVDSTVISWVKQYAPRVVTIGYEYPKFAKVLVKVYNETLDEYFLPQEAKDIFVF